MNDIEGTFPAPRSTMWAITSPEDIGYNCVAWAAGETAAWWWPDAHEQYFWPPDVPRQVTLEAFVEAYRHMGYIRCGSAELEPGFDKIAVFIDATSRPTHAARQLPTGTWTSKLGRSEDIEHELSALEGTQYGSVAVIMTRPHPGRADGDQPL